MPEARIILPSGSGVIDDIIDINGVSNGSNQLLVFPILCSAAEYHRWRGEQCGRKKLGHLVAPAVQKT